MADKPAESFKRSWLRFPAPEKQIVLLLPVLALVAVLGVVVALSVRHARSGALEVLEAQGATADAASHEFLNKTRGFNIVLYAVTAVVGAAAVMWVWWLSVWIFGPYRRLEKDLNDVLYGRMDPGNIQVRKGDALYPLVERIRQVLTRRPPPLP